jgi:nucleotide-binding universal stress UspA family protein
VTLDGSELSRQVIGPVAELIGPEDEVQLVTVVSLPANEPVGAREADFRPSAGAIDNAYISPAAVFTPSEPRLAETGEQALARVATEEAEMLEMAARQLPRTHVTFEVLFDANPAEAIIALAAKRGVNLIAMATHGRSGLSRLVHGSVAQKVLESGVAPVLLVRPRA